MLDANAAIEIALYRDSAIVINSYIEEAHKRITSDLYKAEMANAMHKNLKGEFLDKDSAVARLSYTDSKKEEAFLESVRLRHSVAPTQHFHMS